MRSHLPSRNFKFILKPLQLFIGMIILLNYCSCQKNQIVISNGETFYQFWNTSIPFQSAPSPGAMGLLNLAGDNIWYLKSYLNDDNANSFQATFDISKWICEGTEVSISIRYFSKLAPISVWPVVSTAAGYDGNGNKVSAGVAGRSSYANLKDFCDGWENVVEKVEMDRSRKLLIEGVVFPMGHFLLDEIILLFDDGDCTTTPQQVSYPTGGNTLEPTTNPVTWNPWDWTMSTTYPPYSFDQSTNYPSYQSTNYPSYESTNYPSYQSTEYPTTDFALMSTAAPIYECRPIPQIEADTPLPSPSQGLTNYFQWKLACFKEWILATNQSLDIAGPRDYRMQGQIYDFNATLSNFAGTGLPGDVFLRGLSLLPYQNFYVNLNTGSFDVNLELNTRQFDINFSGMYHSMGSLWSTHPFSAIGSASWSGTYTPSYIQLGMTFAIQNGSIVPDNCYAVPVNYYVTTNWTVSDFTDETVPANLMAEFANTGRSQIFNWLQTTYANHFRTLGNDLLCHFLNAIFAETPVLDIIKTPPITQN